MRKDVIKLLRHVESQVVSILIAHGLVKSEKKKFSDMRLTQKGKSVAGRDDPYITDEWLKEYRLTWPSKQRSNIKVLREKISDFIYENGYTLDEIEQATKKYLKDYKPPYCGKHQYFFSKRVDGIKTSRCLDYMDIKDERDIEDVDTIIIKDRTELM